MVLLNFPSSMLIFKAHNQILPMTARGLSTEEFSISISFPQPIDSTMLALVMLLKVVQTIHFFLQLLKPLSGGKKGRVSIHSLNLSL